jgi:hypothetical protein
LLSPEKARLIGEGEFRELFQSIRITREKGLSLAQ